MHYRNILYEKVTYMPILIWDVHKNQVRQLSQTQQQHNKTQPQHCRWVGHENDCAHQPNPTQATTQNSMVAFMRLRLTFIDHN